MIKHDRSYIGKLQNKFVEKDVAVESVYHLRIEGSEEDCIKARNYFDSNYKVFQLNTKENDYELFFWSNKHITGKLKYFTIAITGHKDIEKSSLVIDKAIEIANALEKICSELSIAIQYTTLEKEDVIKEIAESEYQNKKETFVTNQYGQLGKIKKVGEDFGFFKKGARSRYQPLKKSEVIAMCGW